MKTRHRRIVGLMGGLLTISALYCAPTQARQYALTDLGTLPGGSNSYATGVNSNGKVSGYADFSGSLSTGDLVQHATLWDGTILIDLGTLGGSASAANGINDSGHVVGTANLAGDSAEHATLWKGTKAIDLGTLGGNGSSASGINNSGRAVGSSATTTGFKGPVHATLYYRSTATDLGTLGGTFSIAFSINDSGHAVGWSLLADNSTQHATLWSGKSITDLGTLGGPFSAAYSINNAGQTVGFADTAGANFFSHAALWNGATTAVDLGTLGGTTSVADGINNAGIVVGSADTANQVGHAALWKHGKVTDLNTELTGALAAYVTLIEAVAISDNGLIAANGVDSRTGDTHAYLLMPGGDDRD